MRRLAASRERSAGSLMREEISQYVEREERREAFIRDGREAWDDYSRTGLHLTEAEADRWLADLEAGEDVVPPRCHG
ncbi:CopG family ribbon-helix-helix protein [Aureimonas endophytica]|nr:ribbon-helix-helix domain-containing protein [Aureimonas endophytica]